LIKGKTIENKRNYKVLTNNFLVEGGDGLLSFKKSDWKKETHIGVVQTMIDYMKSFEVYTPKISGRVVKVNKYLESNLSHLNIKELRRIFVALFCFTLGLR
jgi:2',3'-cyclic-nucleotide 2'-phosphodiesterase (5'-nucleotidase family)